MTQNERVLRHLKTFGKITTLEAFQDYGITRLSARIWDLRHMGLMISSEMGHAKNCFGEPTNYAIYKLVG